MRADELHTDLARAGHRVASVRLAAGAPQVLMVPGATEDERRAAQTAADAWTPDADAARARRGGGLLGALAALEHERRGGPAAPAWCVALVERAAQRAREA